MNAVKFRVFSHALESHSGRGGCAVDGEMKCVEVSDGLNPANWIPHPKYFLSNDRVSVEWREWEGSTARKHREADQARTARGECNRDTS